MTQLYRSGTTTYFIGQNSTACKLRFKANNTDTYPYLELEGNAGGTLRMNSGLFTIYDTTNKIFEVKGTYLNIAINGSAPSANCDLALVGDGVLCLAETSTPTADTNYGKVYCKNDDKLYFQDGAGNEHEIAFA